MTRLAVAIVAAAALLAAGWLGYRATLAQGERMGRAAMAAELQAALDAHTADRATYRANLSACEAELIIGETLQAAALAARERELAAANERAQAAEAAQAALMTTPSCKTWALEASCVL